MDKAELIQTVSRIKKSKKTVTNCYVNFNLIEKNDWKAYSTDMSLIIINEEYKVKRIWFYTADADELALAADRFLERDEEYILDFPSKEPRQLTETVKKAGFEPIAEMLRLSNNDISGIFRPDSAVYQYIDGDYGRTACLEDADNIYKTLWSVFDTRISRLPDKNEITRSILNNEFFIYKNDSAQIISLLQAVTAPKRFYINQVFNKGDKKIIHSIMLKCLKSYAEAGGKYVYSWVEKNNIASLKFHQKYELKPDGLYNTVYARNKK